MRRIIICIAVLASMQAACQKLGGQADRTTPEVSVTGQLSSSELVNRVRDIYATVFSAYIEEDSLRNLDLPVGEGAYGKREQFNALYCSQDLNELFRQVNEIDSMYHSDELGFFDADYWIMGQDYGSDLKVSDIKIVSKSGNEAVVEMLINNLGSTKPVRLKMLNENGSWKIDSFIDVKYDFDLKSEMEEYVLTETKNN